MTAQRDAGMLPARGEGVSPSDPAPADKMTASVSEGLYIYAVARAHAHWLLGPVGLDGEMVYTVPHGQLCCLVHSCRAKPYESAAAAVVQGWVMAHHGVVNTVQEAFGTVLPMSFNTVVHSPAGGQAIDELRAWLDRNEQAFLGRLDLLSAKAEYGVQILWDRQAVTADVVRGDPGLQALARQADAKTSGTAYLLRQQLARQARQVVEDHASRLVQDIYARVRPCVDEVRVEKLRHQDGSRQMLLSLSCLAGDGGRALGAALDEVRARPGLSVRFTGPWPPYSFAAA